MIMHTSNLYKYGVALFDTKYRYLQRFIYSASMLISGFFIQWKWFKFRII
jgi:hypothetical protein